MAEADSNPYVGPRPFERTDRALFFGRSRETRDVASLVVAQSVLLVYAASGAGKSSLLNAGVVPMLQAKGHEVLPAARILTAADVPTDVQNVYAYALLTHLGEAAAGQRTITEALAATPNRERGGLRVLVVDQFEELFSAYPQHWQRRADLFDQLREALAGDPQLRLVLAIREDFLAQLEPFALRLPGTLGNRFRLEQLDRDGALAAVERPLERTARRFAPGVAEALVADLRRFRVNLGHGRTAEVEGEFVEPVQLQVVCRSLWDELPVDVDQITSRHVQTFADVDQVLRRFYDEALTAALSTRRVRESRVRAWIEEELVTPGGTRGAVYGENGSAGGMPGEIVAALAEKRLVRAEWRAGARWYELTHDRLIGPIRSSNEAFRAASRRRKTTSAGIAAALVVAIAGVVAWLTLDVGAGATQAAGVSIGAIQVQRGVLNSTGAGVPRIGTPDPEDLGTEVAFRLSVKGFRGRTIEVQVAALDAEARTLIPAGRRSTEIPIRSAAVVAQRRLWLPLNNSIPPFVIRIEVYESGTATANRAALARATSLIAVPPPPPAPAACVPSAPGDGVFVNAQAGEIVCGSRGNDRILARVGGNVLFGFQGNDVFETKNGQPDEIFGGPGRDRATVDPFDTVTGVEAVSR